MRTEKFLFLILAACSILFAGPSLAGDTHTINAEARRFVPDVLYVKPGDTVQFTNMTSHNSVSQEGLIPDGATSWRGQLGENLNLTLDKEGVYAYVCEPHIGFGMVGVIVVGQPVNLEQALAHADKNLQGPFRRLIGTLKKVQAPVAQK
jgi:pseudoazurin